MRQRSHFEGELLKAKKAAETAKAKDDLLAASGTSYAHRPVRC
jgi:hypothetical protein